MIPESELGFMMNWPPASQVELENGQHSEDETAVSDSHFPASQSWTAPNVCPDS